MDDEKKTTKHLDPIEVLRELSPFDPIAAGHLGMIRAGVAETDAIALALRHYAEANRRLRDLLMLKLETECGPVIVYKP
jgi:hypothetical protein